MGRDGTDGAAAVKAAGGRVLVEAASTCTVWGMPRAVAEAGLADQVLPLGKMAEAIVRSLV
jgi:two-component system chemotaxis response regulator CheB